MDCPKLPKAAHWTGLDSPLTSMGGQDKGVSGCPPTVQTCPPKIAHTGYLYTNMLIILLNNHIYALFYAQMGRFGQVWDLARAGWAGLDLAQLDFGH